MNLHKLSEKELSLTSRYHEAGHAVAAALLDRPFRLIMTNPEYMAPYYQGKVTGQFVQPAYEDDMSVDDALKEMLINMAGKAAEELLLEERDEYDQGVLTDWMSAAVIAEEFGFEEEAQVERSLDEAVELFKVPAHRECVKLVADALKKDGILIASQVQAICKTQVPTVKVKLVS
jgi:hypothetical protein